MVTSLMVKSPRSDVPLRVKMNRTKYSRLAAAALSASILAAAPHVAAKDQAVQPALAASSCSGMGLVWWNELLAPETDKLADFYSKVVGWKLKSVDVEDQTSPAGSPSDRYTMFLAGDQEAAGLMKADHPAAIYPGVGWFTYIQVADVATAVAAAQASGGSVVKEPFDNPDGSRIAVVRDPMGNVFGLVTPDKKGSC